MSILIALAATAALGFIAGRLSVRPRTRRLDAEIASLHGKIKALDCQLRLMEYLADHDPLTGLHNRRGAAKLFLLAELTSRPTIVALLDLDRFKHVNDTYGHHTGDELLRVVAERLTRAVSVYDGIAARLSGDEFLLLLPVTDEHLDLSMGRIMDVLAEPASLHTDGGQVSVTPTASAGVAIYDGTHGDLDAMLHHVDVALYHAKQQRGSHRIYQPKMRMPRNASRYGPRRRDQHPADSGEQLGGEAIA